jgi:L-lactate dehydrogenase complex protein LldE
VAATDPDLLLAGDLGCLLNMAGKLKREGRRIAVRHVAEVLAGEISDPPIAGSGK